MKTLLWIPARGGSIRLPNKNLLRVGGATLLARTVWIARQLVAARGIDARIVVDTDDEGIREEALACGAEVPFLREAALAGADAGSAEAALRFVERVAALGFKAEAVVALQPTSPLRELTHVLECWDRFIEGRQAVVSVRRADVEVSSGLVMSAADRLSSVGPSQPGPYYCASGAFYAVKVSHLEQTRSLSLTGDAVGVLTEGVSGLDVDYEYQLHLADGFASRLPADPSNPCVVIAEAGVNHNGDMGLALELIDVAADAGADYVKFQTFDPRRLVSRTAVKAIYQIENSGTAESQFHMLEGLMLPPEWHDALLDRCAQRDVGFMSSPFDEASADFLVGLGVDLLKIPSGEITNWAFLDHVAATGLPIILSTGMSTLGEVMNAVERLQRAGTGEVTLLHCVSNYPTAPADVNLRAVDTLRAVFGGRPGWSDHTLGIAISLAAVARGAAVIEKHFTLDRDLDGPDHRASLEPAELADLVRGIRHIESALGSGIKEPRPSEAPMADVARKSLHSLVDLGPGTVLTSDHLIALRPGTGISPTRLGEVLGRPLTKSLAAGEILRDEDLG